MYRVLIFKVSVPIGKIRVSALINCLLGKEREKCLSSIGEARWGEGGTGCVSLRAAADAAVGSRFLTEYDRYCVCHSGQEYSE